MPIEIFRALHQGPALLVLPNAWDAGTARLIESMGAKAIATTSAGLAWSRGYPDGNALPIDQDIAATRDIARVIRVPLTGSTSRQATQITRAVARLVVRILRYTYPRALFLHTYNRNKAGDAHTSCI